MFCHRTYAPKSFAKFILLRDIPKISKSREAAVFLSGRGVENLFDFFKKLSSEEIKRISNKHARQILQDLHEQVTCWMQKEEVKVRFSENIPAPQKTPTGESRYILIALLIFEPFLGNRKNIKRVKQSYLSNMYISQKKNRQKKTLKFRHNHIQMRRLKFAS